MKKISVLTFFVLILMAINSFGAGEGPEAKQVEEEVSIAPQDTLSEEEDDGLPISLGFDLVSRYVWRGVDYGMTPAFQPALSYSTGNDVVSFEIGAWASYSITGNFAEMDLYTTVSFPYVWVGLTDYFFPVETAANDNYFFYKKGTGHVYEVAAGFDGPEKFPISAWIGYNINDAGADAAHDKSTLYFELDYSCSMKKDIGLDVFLGGANGSYYVQKDRDGDGIGDFNFVNAGITVSKEFTLGKKDNILMPLSVSLIGNPDAEKLFLVAGIGIWNN